MTSNAMEMVSQTMVMDSPRLIKEVIQLPLLNLGTSGFEILSMFPNMEKWKIRCEGCKDVGRFVVWK